jgi:hypothetical protein
VNNLTKWLTRSPASLFKFWVLLKLGWIAKAEVRDRDDVGWNPKDFTQLREFDDRDPSHADSFRTCCEPEILDRTAGGVQIGLRDAVASKDCGTCTRGVTCNTHIQGRVKDAFKLEGQVLGPAGLIKELRSSHPFSFIEIVHSHACLTV